MRSAPCRYFVAFLLGLLAPVFSFPQTQPLSHPLEALKTQEYWAIYDVLRDAGKIDADTSYASVLLKEPSKDKVLSWKSGDSVFREADVILLRKGKTMEALIDIAGKKLESFKEVPGVVAPVLESEFRELGEAVKKDPRVIEALKSLFQAVLPEQCNAEVVQRVKIFRIDRERAAVVTFGACVAPHLQCELPGR